jgi:hypothetical protein
LSRAEDWPAILRPVVEARGWRAVWQAGLDALGYPPTWAREVSECLVVLRHVNQGDRT